MKVGMGLADGNYWSSQQIFKDYALYKSQWVTTYQGGPWNTEEAHLLAADENGYPLELPQKINGNDIVVLTALTARGYMPIGDYVLLYDSEADISFTESLKFVSKRQKDT